MTAQLYADDPLMENLFYHCGECDIPVIIHIASKQYNNHRIVDDHHLPRLEKILKKYPKLKIIGHSQCFWSEIDARVTQESRSGYPAGKVIPGRLIELFREYDDLYGDLSATSGYNALIAKP